jgi:hypothetical protein
MSSMSIKEFHKFLMNDVAREVRDQYWKYNVLSEADLQSICWHLIRAYLDRSDPEQTHFKVLNKPYLKGLRIHPDIVVFADGKPWVVIELKESKRLKSATAKKERRRLLQTRRAFGARKGYLFYVARYGTERALKGPKGKGAKYFFEIPITLEMIYPIPTVKKWEAEFRRWAKYSGE